MARNLTKIVEDRIRTWEHASSKNRFTIVKGKKLPVISISREFGGRGAALAKLIGEKTGLKVWDDELLQAIADELGSNEEFLATLDERRREFVEDAVLGFLKNKNTNTNYLRTLIKVVKEIEEHGNSIIVGRGAAFISEHPKSFHLRIVSPLKTRIAGYAKRENIPENKAEEIIRKKDDERAEFVKSNFKRNVSDAATYDLVLNSGTFSLEHMMYIISRSYEYKTDSELEILN